MIQPDEHVASITPVDVVDILLAGPNTAALDLESCFLSPLQGATARRYIEISEICYNALAPFLEEIHTRSATKHGHPPAEGVH